MTTEPSTGPRSEAPPQGRSPGQKGWNIDHLVDRLMNRFPSVPPDDVRQVVNEEFSAFDDARIPTFVPVLVARAAIERLNATQQDRRQ